MQSVPITTNVLGSNLAQTRRVRYNIMWSSLSVKFKDRTTCTFFSFFHEKHLHEICLIYIKLNKSTTRGAQLVLIWMPIDCLFHNTSNYVSILDNILRAANKNNMCPTWGDHKPLHFHHKIVHVEYKSTNLSLDLR